MLKQAFIRLGRLTDILIRYLRRLSPIDRSIGMKPALILQDECPPNRFWLQTILKFYFFFLAEKGLLYTDSEKS